ncbi:vesicular glutamate transporter 2-like isoform X2 [Diabrotica undecimpunctata]|uniref:vesicular glutamate transporter 2-like isoform X2 n=1 Tax=Diabrotica undecimpunctata TaxID=50387 RepID=UPI003B638532
MQTINTDLSWKIWRYKRYVLAILGFFGFMNVYALRSNLSIAIVDMTQLKNITLDNGTTVLKKEFDWDSQLQGFVLSSFFYGYIFTQIVGGFLAAKLGGTWVFSFGIASTSFFTLITPWVAKTNVYFFIVIRTIEGLCELSGAIGLLWFIIWIIIVAETPSKDKRINPEERKYIVDAISTVKSDESIKVPWRRLLTSTAVMANTLCLTCEGWGFYTLLTFLPQMIKSLLGFDLNKVGFLSALPYLLMSIMVQVGGYAADFILKRKYLNTTQVRKLSIISGFSAQAIFILLAGYWVSTVSTLFCLVVAVGLGGLAVSGLSINPLDIAPKFASVILGINNTVASLPGIVSPILTGYLVTDPTNIYQWRVVFYISAGTYLFGVIISSVFTSGVKQSWADKKEIVVSGNHNKSYEPNESH